MLYKSLLGHTHPQYTYQRVVGTLSNVVICYNTQGLAYILWALSYCTIVEGVEYKVDQYITNGLLHYEDCSKGQYWTNKKER